MNLLIRGKLILQFFSTHFCQGKKRHFDIYWTLISNAIILLKTFLKQEAHLYAVFKWTDKNATPAYVQILFEKWKLLTLYHLSCASPGAWHMVLNNYLITDRFS